MTSSWRVLALLPLLAVAACGSGVPADDDALAPPASAGSAAPDALVLQVVRAGGFSPVGAAFRSVPAVSVYGDGRVVTEGPQIELWPPPALPSVQVGRLGDDEVRRLVAAGRALVEAGDDVGQPPVADAPTTAVVVPDGDRLAVASVLALDELTAEGSGLTPEQLAARERFRTYVQQVRDAASAVTEQPYDVAGLAVLAEPYGEPPAAPELPPASLPSSGADWPGAPLEPGACTVVTGDALATVLEAAGAASTETRWTSAGAVLRLAFRPLLPHERTCEDAQQTAVPPSP